MPDSPLIVRGLPPVWGTPSPSPFVIKLLTWLRITGIAHRLVPLRSPPRSSTKKMPYIELPNGEIVSDSARIIARLSRDRGVDLDAGLDDAARGRARLLHNTFESDLYFAGLYERFVTPEGWARTSIDYFSYLPALLRPFARRMARRTALGNLHGQGFGRLGREDVANHARADIDAIASTLGSQTYFLGDTPRTIDATAYGLLCAISSNPFPSAARQRIESHANLTAYLTRMREAYWRAPS